jgi:hypothetical protein
VIEELPNDLVVKKTSKPEYDHLLNKINTMSPYKFLKKPAGENFFKNE